MEAIHGADEDDPESTDQTDVTVHASSPNRVVFAEDGNRDGWIATDLSVVPER